MRLDSGFELPPDKQRLMARARRLEWITLGYIVSATVIVALVLGQSQSMKTAWMDDLLSLIPIAVFLVGSRISQWEPNERFPYGYHRVTSAAYLAAAVACREHVKMSGLRSTSNVRSDADVLWAG
jgi:divalent metal cation (Fe/Co/Zn/Cd) transporter